MFVHSSPIAVVLVTLLSFVTSRPQSLSQGQDTGSSLESGTFPGSNLNSSLTTNPDPTPSNGLVNNTNTSPQAGPSTASVSSSQPATNMCGNDQQIILDGTLWLVANTERLSRSENVCKGYANVALTQGLGNPISSINSIPATYQWTRTNTSPFKGNICFDFLLGPKGDSTSPAATELMLWLEWEGDQLPIGWDAGPAATIPNLFGTSWKIYEGVNHGMTVVSDFVQSFKERS
ncbi:uncharacterized protein KY384_000036 [Bacidia gigantensis]|uniref:uncharacterized protein n=1 Tax=Bacidia gigantensis TaxID=2732470 RepID=UPI001D03B1E3|nr:uncharacterized protein KY384_000036 [Bacidia gigantensis]KAG8526443.1 hypothetical protein KY384_000036 [Bacidia gigantensis]